MPDLATFIRRNSEKILSEWDSFARDLPTGAPMTDTGLRDHAQAMLEVIATDLESPQTDREQKDKSTGASDRVDNRARETAASAHGSGRADSGFSPMQMVAEFRALRASVTHLWIAETDRGGPDDLQQMIRFNEAIDQAIAESLMRYTADIEQTKGRFLAILGHDLRTPLGAIVTSTQFVLDTGHLAEPSLSLITRAAGAARRMTHLVDDLLDLALTRFGDTIPVTRAAMDVGTMLSDVSAEVAAYYPDSRLDVATTGDTNGEWDSARLMQAMVNLVSNSVQHGARGQPITIAARGEADEVVISVQNHGRPIPPEQVERIFKPMQSDAPGGRERRHLGLGLYIVEKIVSAHGGTIEVQSTAEQGTIFTLRVPRAAGSYPVPPADRRQ